MGHPGSNLVWKLLRRNIATGQLVGYALANLVGLVIVMVALQMYVDITSAAGTDGDSDGVGGDFMVISRKVEGLGAVGGDAARFTSAMVADLESQPWVKSVGHFTASDFNVYASTDFAGAGMSTYLFFESVPNEFIDQLPPHWNFDPEHPFIPIILSKDYLALYNFGFAASRGLPQVSESMVGMIPLKVSVSGNGRQQWIPARVVGFSSRLNTIVVPQQFMDWANARFGDVSDAAVEPSRLIVEVDNPGNPAIKDYIKQNGLETGGDKLSSGRMSYLFMVLAGVVITVGLVFTALALFVLLLSLYLLIQKSRDKLRNLILLGYTSDVLAGYYIRLITVINAGVLVLGVCALSVARHYWLSILGQMGMRGGSVWMSVTAALVILLAITGIGAVVIRRHIRS